MSRADDLTRAVTEWATAEKARLQKIVDSHRRLLQSRGDLAAGAVESTVPYVQDVVNSFLTGE